MSEPKFERLIGYPSDLRKDDQWCPYIPDEAEAAWWIMVSDTHGRAIGSDEIRDFSNLGSKPADRGPLVIWRPQIPTD